MKKIPLFKVFVAPEAKEEVAKVLDSGYIGQGPKVEDFENELKNHFENDCVLTLNSCTSALQLAVHLIKPESGWDENDEIIVTPQTCFATVAAILANGAKIKWADVDMETCNIDLLDVERKLSRHTKAITIVHWGGYPVDLTKLKNIQEKYFQNYGKELPVIEDCAHCWDTKYKGELIGNSGNFCCFSFQAIKFLTTGDGGLLITPNNNTYKRAKLLRWFGLDRDAGVSFRCIQDIRESGFKYQPNDIAAAIGLSNLPYMQNLINKHKENAKYYQEELKSCPGIMLLKEQKNIEPSYWIFTLKVENRKDFIKHLELHGITASPVHTRCDKHTSVKQFKSFLPNLDKLNEIHCAIPCGWWVSPEDRNYIVKTIKKGW